MNYLERIAKKYFPVWTSDGIDDFHADVNEIAAWLKRTDLYTAADAELVDLTDDEIENIAAIISKKVKDERGAEDE